VGVGLGLLGFHSAWPDTGSRFDVKLLATTREQFQFRVRHRLAASAERSWEWRGEADALWFPDSYFGGGNAPRDGDEHYYTPKGGSLSAAWFKTVSGPARFTFSGKALSFRIEDVRKADGAAADPAVLGPGVRGYAGGFADLWEAGFEIDGRDDPVLPSRGYYAGHRLGRSLAGEFDYASAESWATGHWAFAGRWEAAAKAWQKTLTGEPPFFLEPHLGDEKILRGVRHKRFRDRSAQAFQAELRFGFPLALPLFASWLGRNWQIAAFGETGRVGSDFAAASRASPHFSGGMGGRLIVGKRHGAIRGDIAFSPYGAALIVDFNQAF